MFQDSPLPSREAIRQRGAETEVGRDALHLSRCAPRVLSLAWRLALASGGTYYLGLTKADGVVVVQSTDHCHSICTRLLLPRVKRVIARTRDAMHR